MRKFNLFLFLIFSGTFFGQDPIGATINGNLIDLRGSSIPMGNAVTIEGTPFYNPNWSRGTVTLQDKKKYEAVSLKLNLYSNDVHYIDETAKSELVAMKGTIQEIELEDVENDGKKVVFRCGYPTVGKNDRGTYYRVLTGGKMSFLLQFKKTIVEEKQFNAASVIQKFRTNKFTFFT